jgi:hypothetical protein
MGLLSAPLTLVRAPIRLSLRAAEVGLSGAAEAARIGMELLDPDRERPPADFSEYRTGDYPAGNGGAPTADPIEPVEPSTPSVVVEAEVPDAPPAVPDELIPDHVDEDPVLVAEVAEEGAEEGAGPELTVEEPWEGYAHMTAADIRDRLAAATAVEAAGVELYESTHKKRRSVMDAAARALSR